MMDVANIHASCVVLAPLGDDLRDAGILLVGDSGAGKSDLALRVIEQGGRLVADDRTDLFVEGGRLRARAPATLAGLLEVRGVGIVALPYESATEIALVVELTGTDVVPRLPEPARYAPPAPLALAGQFCPPLIRLNGFDLSAVAKLRLAVAAFRQNLFRDAPNQ